MKELEQFLLENNFREDKKNNAIYGVFKTFPVIVIYDGAHKQFLITVNAREAEGSDNAKHREDFNVIKQDIENVNYINYNDGLVSINMAQAKGMDNDNLVTVLKKVTSYCELEGFRHTCKYCQNETGLDFYDIQGNVDCLCNECYEKIINAANEKKAKKENFGAGIGGAILGALIGVVVWVVAYQFGFIVAIAGYLMVVCAVKGYMMFSGGLSKTGLWTTVIISILMLAFAEYLCVAIELSKLYDASFIDAFKATATFLQFPEIMEVVLKDIAFGFVFMAIASFRYVKTLHQYVSQSFEARRLD